MKMKEEDFTHFQIAQKSGITHKDQVKAWYSQYGQMVKAAFIDKQRRRDEYKDQDCYVRKLKMENKILKRYLEILNKEGKNKISSSRFFA